MMYFIFGLPKTSKTSDYILMALDHLTKVVYFCKVAREVVGGECRGPIVIIVEVIQCKVD
jgi:hypothetical protein